MGISQDTRHKRRATGGKKAAFRKKRKHRLGRPPAMTQIGVPRVRTVRVRGGNIKLRALRLDAGNFSWPSEGITRKARITSVVYNGTNNELVRTNTLVKGEVVQIDATPLRLWYETHYGVVFGKKKAKKDESTPAPAAETPAPAAEGEKKKAVNPGAGQSAKGTSTGVISEKASIVRNEKLFKQRSRVRAVDPLFEEQLAAGRVFALITTSPGQVGVVHGYVLEGKELEFYLKKTQKKKSAAAK